LIINNGLGKKTSSLTALVSRWKCWILLGIGKGAYAERCTRALSPLVENKVVDERYNERSTGACGRVA